MARTIVGVNDPKAVKHFSAFLAVDTAKISYFSKKFMGYGETASTPIQMLSDLESDAGDSIAFDLSMQLKMQGVEGDDTLEGQEEDLKFYTDSILIDQMRAGVNGGGRMTRKRTVHDLRQVARRRQSEWWARCFDELFFMYLSGSMGSNTGWLFPSNYPGFAKNPLTTPDAEHIMYGGNATSKADVDAADIMSVNLIERAQTKAEVMGGGSQETPQLQPVMIDGEEHYCLVMHPFAAHDLRTATGSSDWLEIQKAAASAEGRKNPIFKGALGMIDGVVLHKHKNAVTFNDYGVGADVPASRSLFMGEQAAVCAFGSSGNNLRFDWHEETRDNGNQLVISTSSIFGVKKTTFNGKDYGVIALDTAAKDPNTP
jgi:N4-gp56 family major capsid protein